MAILLRDVVLAYPNLYTPRAYTGGGPNVDPNGRKNYSAVICIPRDYDATHNNALTNLMEHCGELLQQRLGDKLPALAKAGKVRWPFKMTDKPKDNTKKDGSPMVDAERFICWFTSTSLNKPGTLDRRPDLNGKPIELQQPRPDKLYSGAIVNVLVAPAFSDYGTPQISLFLNHIQHWADAPRLDNQVAPQDAFQADPTMEAVAIEADDAGSTVDSHVSAGNSTRGQKFSDLFVT